MINEKTYGYMLFGFIGTACVYIGVEPVVILILVGSFILDFLTGMLKAYYKGNYKSKIGWVKTIAKILGMLLVGLVGLVFKVLGLPHNYFVMSSLMGLALHDLISCTRNLYVIRTNKELPELDVISLIIRSIHNKLTLLVKKMFGEPTDKDEGG